jgi:hypothetical protein
VASAAAHDLNDELTVILSSIGESLEYLEAEHPARALLLDAWSAVQRCAWKTSSLLTYGARHGARRAATPMEALIDLE